MRLIQPSRFTVGWSTVRWLTDSPVLGFQSSSADSSPSPRSPINTLLQPLRWQLTTMGRHNYINWCTRVTTAIAGLDSVLFWSSCSHLFIKTVVTITFMLFGGKWFKNDFSKPVNKVHKTTLVVKMYLFPSTGKKHLNLLGRNIHQSNCHWAFLLNEPNC